MKNLIRFIVLVIITSIAFEACTERSNDNNASHQHVRSINDSIIVSTAEVIKGKVIEDTVIGHWTIKALKDSNDVIVGDDYYPVRDSSVFLTLLYDQQIVCTNKEIRTKDVLGKEGEYFMHWGGHVSWASDSAIYLSFGCFIPASDDCWDMLYQILPDGTSNIIVKDAVMGINGSYDVTEFIALYLNERSVGASASDLKRLFDHFCTKEIADELSSGNIQLVSDDTNFRHAYRTTRIDIKVDSLDSINVKYSFMLNFKPYPEDNNVTDTLYIEVDSLDKIAKIERVFRKII